MYALGPLASSTCLVSREFSSSRGTYIRRVHPTTDSVFAAERLARLLDILRGHGVPVPRMLAYNLRPENGVNRLITYWEDLGMPVQADYYGMGVALRRAQQVPTALLVQLGLPYLECGTTFENLLRQAGSANPEFRRRVEYEVEAALASLPTPIRVVLAHDDLWVKNVLTTPTTTYLLDWDNAGLASPAYDLAFQARAKKQGWLRDEDEAAFCAGTGQALPSPELASLYGTLHRARWALSLLARSSSGDAKAAALLAHEAPLWAQASPA